MSCSIWRQKTQLDQRLPFFDRNIIAHPRVARQGNKRGDGILRVPRPPIPYSPRVFRFIFKLLRGLFVVAIGVAVGAKFMLESNAEPETEEIDLVAIFEGKQLVSSADPFYGGQVLTMFGGVLLDLRKAHPAPTGIDLNVSVLMGGVSLVVPEGWRVVFDGDVFMGGWSDETRTTAEEDVPIVKVTGRIMMGGLQATTRPSVEAVV